ncbi:MAG: hypothetical protein D6741_09340 [Planctomycetota bacterium]|nr:MAG: hypothetical protein D6741_09340 [Planctomycetota bacterium]
MRNDDLRRSAIGLLLVASLATSLGTSALGSEPRTEEGLLLRGTKWETPYFIIDSGKPGPVLLITGGLHGNEPAGAAAADRIRRWSIARGKLIVVPQANRPGLEQHTRWLPGEPEETRNLNRNFPTRDNPAPPKTEPAKSLWAFIRRCDPDWVVDLHEGYDFRIANPKSDGTSIIYLGSPELHSIARRMQEVVNAEIDDPNRRFVRLSKSGPVRGGLVRATIELLGAKGFCLETTYRHQPLEVRVRQHCLMVGCLMQELGMLREIPETLAPASQP